MAEQTETTAVCLRCEENLDTDGKPKWCKKCRAKYQREYQATKKEMSEVRGYAAGANAMRNAIAVRFQCFGSAQFSGIEAAHIAMKTQPPGEEPIASNGG